MEVKNPEEITRADVGETNPPQQENRTGVGGYLGLQARMWALVIALAAVFVVIILAFAL
ncbi:MAG TPA: hypothetical protein VIL01_15225 [Thermomicrobiales bacterium]